jgi:hypothetical protein
LNALRSKPDEISDTESAAGHAHVRSALDDAGPAKTTRRGSPAGVAAQS